MRASRQHLTWSETMAPGVPTDHQELIRVVLHYLISKSALTYSSDRMQAGDSIDKN